MEKRLKKSAITIAIVTLCLLLAAVLVFVFVPAPRKAYAENEPSVWDGDLAAAGWGSTEANKPAAPEGYVLTGEKKLEIGSAAAFAYFAHEVFEGNIADGYTVTLTVDIDLDNKTWIPIGTTKRSDIPTRRFSGTFDGNEHTISNFSSAGYYDNIKYSAADGYYVDVKGDDSLKVPFENSNGEFSYGLFGVTANMTVKNLTLSNVHFDFQVESEGKATNKVVNGVKLIPDNIGAIIGHNAGRLLVENCVSGQQKADGTADSTIKIATENTPAIGGLVGRAYGIKQSDENTTNREKIEIKNSKNYIDLECTAVVVPDATSDSYAKVSGILGYSTSYSELKFDKCVNYGNINGGQFVGGIMSYFTDNSKKQATEDSGVRGSRAWKLIIDDCVNYGDITPSNLDNELGFQDGRTYSGGIMGYLATSNDNSASKLVASSSLSGQLPDIHFYVRRCRNYGTIGTYNTSKTNGNNRVGGIFGYFVPSESGKNEITDNYNYGDVKIIDKKENGNNPRMGGYVGWLSFYSGGTGAASREIKLILTGGSCGKVADGSYVENYVGSLIGYRLYQKGNIALVDANDYAKNIISAASSDTSVTVAADVTKIEAGEYLGQKQLTEVNFAEGGKLTKIGEWAFAGTGITQVYLPESVTDIGEYAFGGNVLVIAKDREHYKKLVESDNVSDDVKELLTYVVPVEYCLLETVFATDNKLFGKEYAWACDDNGVWSKMNIEDIGPDDTDVVWYNADKGNKALTIDDVNELLGKDDLDKLVLITYESDTKVFYARENIVYDGTTYTMSELNPLLRAAGDRILLSMTATIEGYVDPDGNTTSDDDLPTVIHDAGTYTIRVVEGSNDYDTFDITIHRATVDLGTYSNLSWRVARIGSEGYNAELLNGNGVTLYMYTDKNDNVYPSTTILTDDQIAKLELKDGTYTTKTVLYSVARNRNKNITIRVTPNEDKYKVSYYVNDAGSTISSYVNNVGNKVGMYQSSVTLIANKNYKFTASAVSAQRGLNIAIDGNNATVTKTWYIVDMPNWLVNSSGKDYTISNRVFGVDAAVSAPALMYGTADKISMTLRLNGTLVGNANFGVGDFSRYVNRSMPAGNYELSVVVAGVNSEEVDTNAPTTDEDEEPVMVEVYRSGFTDTVLFTVQKAQLPSLENVNAALKGKTFTYTWDGASHLYNDEAAKAVNAYLGASMLGRTGIWADSQYNNYYGNFNITYNLSRMQSDAYYGANDMTVAAVDPDKYTVYYRVSAPNYYSSTETLAAGEVRHDYYFEVVIIREIEVPEVSNVAYTGSAVYPTITPAATGDEAFYEVLWANEGYLTGGQRTVTFRLRNSDYYCWAGEEIGIDVIVVPFRVVEADNAWLRTPNIVSWLYEEYNTEVNRIRAVPKFLDEGQSVKFTVTDSEGNAVAGLSAFTVKEDGTLSDKTIIAALNGLKAGSYKLEVLVAATNNYKVLTADIDFKIGKAMNSWADGDEDLVLPGWIVGKYNATENTIVVNPAHGAANIIITDIDGNEYYNSVTGLNKLNDCEVGKYLLKAWVDETADFAALAERTFTIEVFEKAGMPWWGTLLITLGALLIAALIIFILWKKGVFQILTGKIILAIRNKATVDATIAAVRANKKAEEARKSVEEAKKKERMEELKAKAAEARALPAEQRAAALEEKAKKAAERAEKMRVKAESMQMRADRMKERAVEKEMPTEEELRQAANAEAPSSEIPLTETPETEAPVAEPATEAAATEQPIAEQPVSEAPAEEEPKAEQPATEAAATEQPQAQEKPKTTKTPAKKKPSNKK